MMPLNPFAFFGLCRSLFEVSTSFPPTVCAQEKAFSVRGWGVCFGLLNCACMSLLDNSETKKVHVNRCLQAILHCFGLYGTRTGTLSWINPILLPEIPGIYQAKCWMSAIYVCVCTSARLQTTSNIYQKGQVISK